MSDFGPMPVSRLSDETGAFFKALDAGRRVLIARHGRVVAVVEPASIDQHTTELAAYALQAESRLPEVTSSGLNQNPSDAVKQAEDGQPFLVTRNGRVHGVLKPYEPAQEFTLDEVIAQERRLSAFERTHPEATVDDLAAETAEVLAGSATPARSGLPDSYSNPDRAGVRPPTDVREKRQPGWRWFGGSLPATWVTTHAAPSELLDEAVARTEDLGRRTYSDALFIRGLAFEQSNDLQSAAETFELLVDSFAHIPDVYLQARVARSRVELARLHTVEDRPDEALRLTYEVVEAFTRQRGVHDETPDVAAPAAAAERA